MIAKQVGPKAESTEVVEAWKADADTDTKGKSPSQGPAGAYQLGYM